MHASAPAAVPMASLTRVEAARRANLITVDRYDINLDFTGLLEGTTFRSTSTATFRAVPGSSTFVDCVAEIASATLNGVALDPATAYAGRLPLTGLAETNTLVVTTQQADTESSRGILRSVDPADGSVYVWISTEPDDARRLWACFDQPDLKAVYAITATVPGTWLAVSNTAAASITRQAESLTYGFADSPPLSTYHMVVNAGPFHVVERQGEFDMRLYCRQSLRAPLERDADDIFAAAVHGLTWFGEKFGMRFPQQTFSQVFVPNMGGAMENWGCVTYGDYLLTRSDPTHAQRADRAMVVLHELAHMWFGDLVTMRWWDDLWLNEAFASWASVWALAAMPEFTDAWATVHVRYKQPA